MEFQQTWTRKRAWKPTRVEIGGGLTKIIFLRTYIVETTICGTKKTVKRLAL